MTSTTDKAGHPDVAEIADLSAGLLSPSRTADVRQHLEGCSLCSEVHDSLEEIRGLLGTLPGPPRMPDDVAERIDAALAAEALLSATAPDDAADTDRAHVSRETSTADSPSGHPRGATGPGRSHRARRGRRRTVLLTTAFAAAALGLGAILVQSLGGDSSGTPQTASRRESGSLSTFSEKTLHGEVSDLLTKNKKSGDSPDSAKSWGVQSQDAGTDPGDVKTLITPTPAVPQCVEQGTGDPGVLLAAKAGSFQGKGVYLLVVSDVADRAKVTAYIVDAACEKQASPSPGKLLLTRSYPRS